MPKAHQTRNMTTKVAETVTNPARNNTPVHPASRRNDSSSSNRTPRSTSVAAPDNSLELLEKRLFSSFYRMLDNQFVAFVDRLKQLEARLSMQIDEVCSTFNSQVTKLRDKVETVQHDLAVVSNELEDLRRQSRHRDVVIWSTPTTENDNLRADYWKSNDRKFCDFCKCWITDNKPSVAFHENGRRHKANVAKRISEITRNSTKSEKEKQKMDQEIRKMEEAALRSYAVDVSAKADMTAKKIKAVMENSPNTSTYTARPGAQVDPLLPPGDFDDEEFGPNRMISKKVIAEPVEDSMWVEAKSPDGYTYYWNVKTNKSVWEPPKEGFMSIDEYERINQIALAQQQLQLKKDSQTFQDSAAEVVAKYNRERLKAFRRPDPEEIEKRMKRETYKTEEDVIGAQDIGEWQTVVKKEEPAPIDLELPKQEYYVPQVVTDIAPEPPQKRFKEKTINALQPDAAVGMSSTFKKRKFAARGNTRQRLDED